jgi:RND family efflux transporter MFP subunit
MMSRYIFVSAPTARVHWIALALGFALAGAVGHALAADRFDVGAEQQRAFGVELAAPAPAGDVLSRRYPAEVAVPIRQARVVSAPQGGTLTSLLVAEGETVAKGQELAELSSPDLLEAQGSLLEAVTKRNLAASELERDRQLHAEGLAPKRRLLETEARFAELSTAVEQWSQRLVLAGMPVDAVERLKQDRRLSSVLAIRAPMDGVVLEQMVSTGQAVAAAAPLYRIGRLAPLWLEIHVPVNQIAGVAAGARVVLPREDLEGQVITIGRMVHGEDQGVLVRAEVKEGTERLRPGQFVEVQLAEAAAQSGWRLPAAAVVRKEGTAYVFAAVEGGFAALPVEVVAEEEKTAVVSGELTAGARVAVSGVAALKAAWLGGAQ